MKKNINKFSDAKKIIAEVNALRKTVLNLKFQKTTGQLEKTSELKKTKKKIAMLLTQVDHNRRLKNV